MGKSPFGISLKVVSDELKNLGSHDLNDSWLASEIMTKPEEYETAAHVIVGFPSDEGVRRNGGRTGASEGPASIRNRLYRLQKKDRKLNTFDAGDVFGGSLETALATLATVVSICLKDGKKVCVIGGGNDVSLASLEAMHRNFENYYSINIDAHLDMRESGTIHSGTPYSMAIKQGYLNPENHTVFGVQSRSNSIYYLKRAEKWGVRLIEMESLYSSGGLKEFDSILKATAGNPLFTGLDLDALQSADAPGVSAPSPFGFSAREIFLLMKQAFSQADVRIFEVSELNPHYDIDEKTARIAAGLIYEFLYS